MRWVMIDFRLKTFMTVWEEKSFTRASQKLCITQSAVSQHIKMLESQVGKKLFNYESRTLTLTDAGQLLYRYAVTAWSDGLKTLENISRLEDHPLVRIGATRSIGAYLLPELLVSYMHRHPATELTVSVENTRDLLEKLERGLLDFIFLEGIFDQDTYNVQVVMKDAFIPLCSPDHRFAKGQYSLIDLLSERLIVREVGSGSRAVLELALQNLNCTIQSFFRKIELGNIEAIKVLTSRNMGITFLYKQSVMKELQEGSLVQINVRDFTMYHDFCFVTLKNSLYQDVYKELVQ